MSMTVVIASTAGSVLNKVLSIDEVCNNIHMIVSDRACGAIDVGKHYGIETLVLESKDGKDFSDKLYEYFKNSDVQLFLSFYTKLFKGKFLEFAHTRLLNFHPSVLPACPGMDGFGATIKSGCKFIGTTLHLVDSGIDTGKPIIQSIFPYQPNKSLAENRHMLFIQQCKMFIQIIDWSQKNRLINGEVIKANYQFSEFVPNLESELALNFHC